MGWWSGAMREKAGGWAFGPLGAHQVPDSLDHEVVEPETAYLSGFLRSMWITDVRKGVGRFYGTVHSHVSLPHLSGGSAEFHVVVSPPDLRDVDCARADRFVTRNIRLFGPVPYRGGDLEVELGVFSVQAGDLVGPFVDLLEAVSGAAGVALVGGALPFAKPVRRGLDLLLGADGEATLEIGLATTFARPETGSFAVVRRSSDALDLATVGLTDDFRLVNADGEVLVDWPYAVFAIEASPTRPDWFTVPELARPYESLRKDVARATLDAVRESLVTFKKATLASPDLLLRDALNLVEKVRNEVDETLRLTQTGGAERVLRPLEELRLYG